MMARYSATLATAYATLSAAIDDANAALTARDYGAARLHLEAALDARAAIRGAGEPIALAMARELYTIRRTLVIAAGDDARRWFNAPKDNAA